MKDNKIDYYDRILNLSLPSPLGAMRDTDRLDMIDRFAELIQWTNQHAPNGRYKSLALTSLEQAQMWADRAIVEQALLLKKSDETEQAKKD